MMNSDKRDLPESCRQTYQSKWNITQLKAFIEWGFKTGRASIEKIQKIIESKAAEDKEKSVKKEKKKIDSIQLYEEGRKKLKRKAEKAEIPTLDVVVSDDKPKVLFILLNEGLRKMRLAVRSALYRKLDRVRSTVYYGDDSMKVFKSDQEAEMEEKVKELFVSDDLEKIYYKYHDDGEEEKPDLVPHLNIWIQKYFESYFARNNVYVGFIFLDEGGSTTFKQLLATGGITIEEKQEYFVLAVYLKSGDYAKMCGDLKVSK